MFGLLFERASPPVSPEKLSFADDGNTLWESFGETGFGACLGTGGGLFKLKELFDGAFEERGGNAAFEEGFSFGILAMVDMALCCAASCSDADSFASLSRTFLSLPIFSGEVPNFARESRATSDELMRFRSFGIFICNVATLSCSVVIFQSDLTLASAMGEANKVFTTGDGRHASALPAFF